MGKKGLEPLTLRLSSVYSNQLSYLPPFFLQFLESYSSKQKRQYMQIPNILKFFKVIHFVFSKS